MLQPDLKTLLGLVGELTDGGGDEASSTARFRTFLREKLQNHAEVREYVEAALTSSDDQYSRALRELVNHIGALLGFEVEYGRYWSASGKSGSDGVWHSSSGSCVVIEVKMTDPYSPRTLHMLTRLDAQLSRDQSMDRSRVFGLYVLTHPDASAMALERAILSDTRRQPLRVISLQAMLDLLETVQKHRVSHDAVLSLLSPAPVVVDPVVDLVCHLSDPERSSDHTLTPAVSMTTVNESTAARAEPEAPRQLAISRRKVAATLSPIEQERLEFWAALIDRAGPRTRLHSRSRPRERSYLVIRTGIGGLSLAYNILVKGYSAVELYIDRGDRRTNKSVFDQLAEHSQEIERRFGKTITWQRLNKKRACRLIYRMPGGGLYDRDRWPEIQDRMIDAMMRLEAALRPYFDSLEI